MVPAAEIVADLVKRKPGELTGKVHPNLARHHHLTGTPPRLELTRLYSEIGADALRNPLKRGPGGLDLLSKMASHNADIQRSRAEAAQSFKLSDGALKLAAATGQVIGEPGQNLGTNG